MECDLASPATLKLHALAGCNPSSWSPRCTGSCFAEADAIHASCALRELLESTLALAERARLRVCECGIEVAMRDEVFAAIDTSLAQRSVIIETALVATDEALEATRTTCAEVRAVVAATADSAFTPALLAELVQRLECLRTRMCAIPTLDGVVGAIRGVALPIVAPKSPTEPLRLVHHWHLTGNLNDGVGGSHARSFGRAVLVEAPAATSHLRLNGEQDCFVELPRGVLSGGSELNGGRCLPRSSMGGGRRGAGESSAACHDHPPNVTKRAKSHGVALCRRRALLHRLYDPHDLHPAPL